MFIKRLELKNFRNYKDLNLQFVSGVNILTGDNAQGKTNILESLFFCAFGRSHRTSRDSEMFLFDSPFTKIITEVKRERLDKKIDVTFTQGKKFIEINGRKIKKMEDLLGNLNVVIFSPEDLKVVKESPGVRRRFLDMEICALDRIYYHNLVSYNKVLAERNNLLKMRNVDFNILDIYDEKLSQYGSLIELKRKEYLSSLNYEARVIHREITNDKEEIEFLYKAQDREKFENLNEKDRILSALRNSRRIDLVKQSTGVGPHKDDFSILINGADSRFYGSQGQQRTAILTLKFSSLNIIKNITGEYPVLLLDDVLSELDINRQNFILSSIENIQTIITMTGYESIEDRLIDGAKIFNVKEGKISEVN